jgi:hypothetical protein
VKGSVKVHKSGSQRRLRDFAIHTLCCSGGRVDASIGHHALFGVSDGSHPLEISSARAVAKPCRTRHSTSGSLNRSRSVRIPLIVQPAPDRAAPPRRSAPLAAFLSRRSVLVRPSSRPRPFHSDDDPAVLAPVRLGRVGRHGVERAERDHVESLNAADRAAGDDRIASRLGPLA